MTGDDVKVLSAEIEKTALMLARGALDPTVLKLQLEAYLDEGVTLYQARQALRLARRRCVFLPAPAEVFEIIRDDYIPREDPAIPRRSLPGKGETTVRKPTAAEMAETRAALRKLLGRDVVGELAKLFTMPEGPR